MSGPFRELFVEVPQALLEAAVAEAKQRQNSLAYLFKQAYAPRPSLLQRVSSPWFMRQLSQHYGWTAAECRRDPTEQRLVIDIDLGCQHGARMAICERDIESRGRASDLVDLFDRLADEVRRCYCVERDR